MIALSILSFVVIFSILILVHEWGHFAAARRAGVRVEEFGIGLPPRAKSLFKDKSGTVYSLNWVPFGGFVKLYGEDNANPEVARDPRSFASKSIGQRTLVIVAGVLMNFVLAWFLITLGFTIGMKPFLVNQEDIEQGIEQGLIMEKGASLLVQDILPGSNAQKAGLQKEDMVTRVNDKPLTTFEDFQAILKPASAYTFTVVRKQQEVPVSISTNEEGKIGFQFIWAPTYEVNEIRYPLYSAPVHALKEVGRLSITTLKMFGQVVSSLVTRFVVPEGVSGPVGIARLTYQFTQQGIMALVQFAALLSISLGVINIMPFPALDGGRFLFIIFEIILGKRPSAKWEAIIHSTGFALLMLLIIVITWHDIANWLAT